MTEDSKAIELDVIFQHNKEVNVSPSSINGQSDTEGDSNVEDDIQLLPSVNQTSKDSSQLKGTVAHPGSDKNGVKLQKELTIFNSITIVVGEIIGSGIFISSTQVLQYSGSFGLTLIFWTLGGLISMGGGLAYIELGTMIKSSGGEYAYIREGFSFNKKRPAYMVFGTSLGFLYSWTYIMFIRPAANAIITQAFSTYFATAVAGGDPPPEISIKLLAVTAISMQYLVVIITLRVYLVFLVLLSLINVYSLRATAMMINVLSVAKVLALMFISVLGIWQLIEGG